MMVLRNARYGCEDGGMACGPVPGTSNVELMITNDEGKSSFILLSKYCMYETVFVSDLSLFDIVMNMKRYDIDFDNELEKVESNSRYELEYEYEYDPKTDEKKCMKVFRVNIIQQLDLVEKSCLCMKMKNYIKIWMNLSKIH